MMAEKKKSNQPPKSHALKRFVKSKDFYRFLTDSIMDFIWVLDINRFTFSYIAPPIVSILGYAPEEAMGLPLESFMSQEAIDVMKSFIKEEMENETPQVTESWTIEMPLLHKEGSTVWAEVSSCFIRDENEHIIGIVGVTRDCTDRVIAREELRLNEERYRTILENIEEGYCEVDLKGNFTFVNEATSKVIGYSEEEMLEKSYNDVVDEKNGSILLRAFSQVFESGKPYRGLNYEIITKNGSRRQVEISITLIKDKKNRPIGFRGIGGDITRRKQEELKLEKAYEALEQRVQDRTAELSKLNKVLEEKSKGLEEINIALRVLLKKKDEARKEVETQVIFNIMEAIGPLLEKLRDSGLNEKQGFYAEMIESQLREITSPFSHKLSTQFQKLTPAEIQIAHFIKHGMRTKEIAELMSVATSTIDFHRKNIRKKLLAHNKRANLRAYLLSLEK